MRKQLILSAFLVAAALAQAPQGQAPQSVAGVVRLNRAPVSNEVLKVKLPRPVERQLSNGMKLLVVESHRVPSITLRITIPSGDFRDPEGIPGVSDATAATCMEPAGPGTSAHAFARSEHAWRRSWQE